MKKLARLFPVMISMFILFLACSMPADFSSLSQSSVPPNLTLTALFAPPINISTATPSFPTAIIIPSKLPSQMSATETATNTATLTTTSTATNTSTAIWSPCYRSAGNFDAAYMSSAPVIDGVWEEWNTTQYPASYLVYDDASWASEDDLGASFRVGWNNQYLFIAVKVGDDNYVQHAWGQEMYKGDSIEILLDTNLCGDYYSDSLSGDDYQLGISPGNPDVNGTREAFLWYPRSAAGSKSQVLISSVKSDGIYRVEAAIPWSLYGVTPWSGQTYGFALSVSDNDTDSDTVQQSMVSCISGRHLTNPMTWGTLILK